MKFLIKPKTMYNTYWNSFKEAEKIWKERCKDLYLFTVKLIILIFLVYIALTWFTEITIQQLKSSTYPGEDIIFAPVFAAFNLSLSLLDPLALIISGILIIAFTQALIQIYIGLVPGLILSSTLLYLAKDYIDVKKWILELLCKIFPPTVRGNTNNIIEAIYQPYSLFVAICLLATTGIGMYHKIKITTQIHKNKDEFYRSNYYRNLSKKMPTLRKFIYSIFNADHSVAATTNRGVQGMNKRNIERTYKQSPSLSNKKKKKRKISRKSKRINHRRKRKN